MWTSAGRRAISVAHTTRVVAPVVAGRRAIVGAHVAPPPVTLLQSRSFFGLKDLLFGTKPTETNKPTKDEQPTPTVVDDANKTPDVVVGTPVEEPTPTVVVHTGSQDPIKYSVGKYARLADGAVMATRGKSMVLTTAVSMAPSSASSAKKKDFLPLMVDYRVKYHAVGLIPDTIRRSEMTNTDEEILQSRIIDRVIRPMFPRDYCDDTQVLATVQSLDAENDPLVLAVNSTSTALALSDIPWNGPVGCVRVVEIAGQLVANPTAAQRDIATLDLLYAATESRTLMIEANGDEITEERMAEAMRFAHQHIGPLIDEQKQLVKQHGKPKRAYQRTVVNEELWAKATEIGQPLLAELFSTPKSSKVERQLGERETNNAILAALRAHFQGRDDVFEVRWIEWPGSIFVPMVLANENGVGGRDFS